jgi:transposase-like protein
MSTTTSPVRTGHTATNGDQRSRKDLRAPKGPRADRAQRRTFSHDYKLAILAEYDRCTEPGDKGALLRREGLYSSIITDWRRQHREGSLVVTPGRSEGGRGGPSRSEVARLRAENERLKRKLAKAEAIIEVQGKVHALLEELSKSADIDETSSGSSTTA